MSEITKFMRCTGLECGWSVEIQWDSDANDIGSVCCSWQNDLTNGC